MILTLDSAVRQHAEHDTNLVHCVTTHRRQMAAYTTLPLDVFQCQVFYAAIIRKSCGTCKTESTHQVKNKLNTPVL